MFTWPELQTCILCMKRKQESTRFLINLLISSKKKQTNKQNKTNLFDLPNLERMKKNIQEKLSKTNDLILSLFSFFFFFVTFFLIFPLLSEFWPQLDCKYTSFAFLVYL